MARIEDMVIDAPLDKDVEFTLLGGCNGYGESILIRFSTGKWMVIDSCVDQQKRCAPLQYLRKIGVDVTTDVVCVCCTHWHDDHMKGLCQLLEECSSMTKFCMAIPDDKENFLYAFGHIDEIQKDQSHLKGALDILDLIARKNIPVKRIIQDQTICQVTPINKCIALSPSQADLNQFLGEMLSEIVTEERVEIQKKRLSEIPESEIVDAEAVLPDEYIDIPEAQVETEQLLNKKKSKWRLAKINERSVALLLELGGHVVILGSDLEKGNKGHGWQAVMEESECLGDSVAEAYKIAHHGSKNGYCEEFIKKHISSECIGKMSTWFLGDGVLPEDEMIDVYYDAMSQLYITSNPARKRKFYVPAPELRKFIKECTDDVVELSNEVGIIQSRLDTSDPTAIWRTQCFGSAYRYEKEET